MSGPTPTAVVTAPSLVELRTQLDNIRFYQHAKTGQWKDSSLPKNMLYREIQRIVLEGLRARGFFFRATYPYYFDRESSKLYCLTTGDQSFNLLLRALGFCDGEKDAKVLQNYLINKTMLSETYPVHRLSCTTKDATYIRQSETVMFKVPHDGPITEVPLGKDGILLIAGNDLGDWPTLAELQPHMDRVSSLVGDSCTRFIPESPLAKLTSRWDDSKYLSADQQRQIAFTRLLFTFVSTLHELWPILLLTGEGGSGKSTPLELFATLLKGIRKSIKRFSCDEGSIIADLTQATFAAYDNVDGARLDDPKNSSLNDLFCQMSTGAEVTRRKLFADSVPLTYEIKMHCFFTSRQRPFDRDDVLRRTLELSMLPADPDGGVDKKDLFTDVINDRPAMLAELLLRIQNIMRALQSHVKYASACVSNMREYEVFTLTCAAHEGTLDETKAIWTAHTRRNRESSSEHNPMVMAIRLWLGAGGNAGREVSSHELLASIKTVYERLQEKLPYSSLGSFAKQVVKNRTALGILGYERVETKHFNGAVFHPSPEQLAICERMYSDVWTVVSARPTTFTPSPEYKRILYRDADRADKQQAGEDSMYPALDDFDDVPKKEVIQ